MAEFYVLYWKKNLPTYITVQPVFYPATFCVRRKFRN